MKFLNSLSSLAAFATLAICPFQATYASGWQIGGNLTTARTWHATAVLRSGKVLVAGGRNPSANPAGFDEIASVEIYDPNTDVWTQAAPLAGARFFATATVITNGKVLVAGGAAFAADARRAELYDPSTNSWSVAGVPSGSARVRHTATLLPNGKVMIVGGDIRGPSKSVEFYDPVANSWTNAPSLLTARDNHTATVLPNGKVLIIGGGQGAEIFDPTLNTWSAVASPNSGAPFGHTATLLPNGTVLVAGSYSAGAAAEIYDPTTNAWSSVGSMAVGRGYHSGTLMANGKVLIAGGFNNNSANMTWLNSTEIFDPLSGTWSPGPPLNEGRARHSAVLLASGKVMVAAGEFNSSGYLNSTELYDGAPPAYTISVSTLGQGTGFIYSTPSLIFCGSTSGTACTATFTQSTTLQLSAISPDGSKFVGWLGDCSGLSSCSITVDGAKRVTGTFAPPTQSLSLDVNSVGGVQALGDGDTIIRFMREASRNAVGIQTTNAKSAQIAPADAAQYLTNIAPLLDVDGNGGVDAHTDGVLLVRYLFGFRGPSLVANAIGNRPTRWTPTEIEAYIESLLR